MNSNEKKPLLTFALFAYNQEKFIREAVEGALAQTYSPLEIIFSDDCSTDRTFEIIEEMVAGYRGPHRIVLNKNTRNLGLCAHVNKVFGLASGSWIVMAAGDDISLPNRCDELAEAIKRNPNAVAVSSAWQLIDEESGCLETFLPDRFARGRIDRHGSFEWCKKFSKGKSIGVLGASSMWAKKLAVHFGPIASEVPAEDSVLNFRAYLTGDVVYLPELLIRYRSHSGNINGVMDDDLVSIEARKAKFAERNLATLTQIEQDFKCYVETCNRGVGSSEVSQFLRLSSSNLNTTISWWNRDSWWRFMKVVEALRQGNWTAFRWRLVRLGSMTLFVKMTNIKRRLFGKYLWCR